MKLKTTRKTIKEGSRVIISIGYCNAYYLLKGLAPFAYSTRAEGWACDYYDLGGGVIISEGYAPIGKSVGYELTKEYDNNAREINNNYNLSYAEKMEKIAALRAEWLLKALEIVGGWRV